MKAAETISARAERTERRRTQILEAAFACFREEGFHGASMSRIAARADMSVGHIYKYFHNKETIVSALVERDTMLFVDELQKTIATSDDIDTALSGFITRPKQSIENDRISIFLEVLAEAGRSPKIAELYRRMDSEMRKICEDLLRRKSEMSDRPITDIPVRTEMLLLLMQGAVSRRIVKPDGEPCDKMMAGIDWLVRKILSPATAAR